MYEQKLLSPIRIFAPKTLKLTRSFYFIKRPSWLESDLNQINVQNFSLKRQIKSLKFILI